MARSVVQLTVVTASVFLLAWMYGCPSQPPPDGNGPDANVNDNANDNGDDNANENDHENLNGDGDGEAEGGAPEERLQPLDLNYEGAFRLPENVNWGARGLSFYPAGDGGAGSLLVTGFELIYDPAHPGESCWDPSWDCEAFYAEVSIPTPGVESNWQDLPEATALRPMTSFDGGLASSVHREYLFVSDLGESHATSQDTEGHTVRG